jgi:hypothetical protein
MKKARIARHPLAKYEKDAHLRYLCGESDVRLGAEPWKGCRIRARHWDPIGCV